MRSGAYLLAALLFTSVALAAVPAASAAPDCQSADPAAGVACEQSGPPCEETWLGRATSTGGIAGFRCDFGDYTTECLVVALVSWCETHGRFEETSITTVFGIGWSSSPSECRMSALIVAEPCPAGGPPSPTDLPVMWGHVLP